MEARVVRPGEPVRLVNVLDAVEPAAKPAAPRAGFPGLLGELEPAGLGATLRLDGVAVLSLADLDASHAEEVRACQLDGDCVVDMAGPAAFCTPWGATLNVALVFRADPAAALHHVDRGIRAGTLAVAARPGAGGG